LATEGDNLKDKTPKEERAIIFSQPNKRPYGVKVFLHVKSAGTFGFVEKACVSLHTGAFLTIMPAQTAPLEGGKKFVVFIEGFPTAAAAEAAGRRLVQALLWMAVSLDANLRLEYSSYEPAAVFERKRAGGGLSFNCYLEVGNAPNTVFGEIQDAYQALPEPNERMLLSMEIFCMAALEGSQRSIFLTCVSALEPLAKAEPLGLDVNAFVEECINRLETDESSILPDIKNSLKRRLEFLRQESIRQALLRLTREALPNHHDAPKIIDEAYDLRSRIIHNGMPPDLDIDLEFETRRVSNIIRELYASLLNRSVIKTRS
jgi:hypothetical protein